MQLLITPFRRHAILAAIFVAIATVKIQVAIYTSVHFVGEFSDQVQCYLNSEAASNVEMFILTETSDRFIPVTIPIILILTMSILIKIRVKRSQSSSLLYKFDAPSTKTWYRLNGSLSNVCGAAVSR